MTTDHQLAAFMGVLEQAIAMVDGQDATGWPAWRRQQMDVLSTNLRKLRETAQGDKLPRRSRNDVPPGTGLGLTRAVGEWCDDEALLGLIQKVEDAYRLDL